jgi:hypothetical protein
MQVNNFRIMKRFLFISVLLLNITLSHSQQQIVFFNNYPYEWDYDCVDFIIKDNQYYLVGNIVRNFEGCDYWVDGFHVSIISEEGHHDTTYIFDKCAQTTYIGFKGSMSILSEGFLFTGRTINEESGSRLYVLKTNADFDTVSINYYFQDTLTKRALSSLVLDNGNIVICGQIDSTRNELSGIPENYMINGLFMEISASGEVLWTRAIQIGECESNCWDAFSKVIRTYDNGFILIGRTNQFGHRNMLTVMKTDSVGSQEWLRLFGNSQYNNPTFQEIIQTQDSCYVIAGTYTYGEAFGGLYPHDGWLIKLNNNGETVWDKRYREYVNHTSTDWRDTIVCQFLALTELADGGLATIGKNRACHCLGLYHSLYRFDANGNLLWQKTFNCYPDCSSVGSHRYRSVKQTSDGGFAIAGDMRYCVYETGSGWDCEGRLFLIKTDSLGNHEIVTYFEPYEQININEFNLEFYPNPAKNELYVDLPESMHADMLQIFSITGSLVLSAKVLGGNNYINIENIPSGMYLLRLKKSNQYGKLIIE